MFKLKVVFLRLEELTLKEILQHLRISSISIGMHGSILITNMFLPLNALSIELYPYGVPSENYTPYRTMARLNGMDLRYIPWEVSFSFLFFFLFSFSIFQN